MPCPPRHIVSLVSRSAPNAASRGPPPPHKPRSQAANLPIRAMCEPFERTVVMIGSPQPSHNPPAPGALRECLMILLKAIGRNVVVAEENDANEFRVRLTELEKSCENSQEIPRAVDAVTDLLAEYVQRSNQLIARQRSELMMLVSELTTAMASLPDVQRSSERLS